MPPVTQSQPERNDPPEDRAARAAGEAAASPPEELQEAGAGEARGADADDDPERLRAQRDDYLARWQRAQADYQNLKRRTQSDLDARLRRTLQPLLEDLLLVLDHLDMALASPAEGEEAASLAQGVRLTRDQLVRALEGQDVRPVPEGGSFDPSVHLAVATVQHPEVEPGTVVDTVRRGYSWRDGVLRYAQVRVAAGEEGSEEPVPKAGAADPPTDGDGEAR